MSQPLAVAFVCSLVWRFRGLQARFAEHLEDNEGEILPHPFMADVERWAESLLADRRDELAALLDALADGVERGDEAVRNLIDVSFVEELPYPDQPNSEIRDLLPAPLRNLLRHGL
jgi:hypothetical protein